jgi:hypothetical protein
MLLLGTLTVDRPLCRPSGWAALWRRMGNLSVLNRKAVSLS